MIHTQYFLVLFPFAGNYFLWQEIISFGRKLLFLTGNYFPWQEIISFAGTYFLWQELIPLAGNHFTWHEIISLDMKLFHLA